EWVHINEYLDEVMNILPDRASVWGSSIFGLPSGVLVDFVQFVDAVRLAKDFPPGQQLDALSPDFFVFNDLLKDISYFSVVQRADRTAASASLLDVVPTLFPKERYGLVALVDAPPYGTTRVYTRVQEDRPTGAPLVAVNQGTSAQWARSLGPPMPFSADAVEPATFTLTLQKTVEAAADRSQVVRLPAGVYMITASVQGTSAHSVGLMAAAPVRRFVSTATADLGFNMAQAPYFPGENRVHFIVRHPGGPLYVSQFDGNPGASFAIAEVRPVEYLQPSRQASRQIIRIPPLSRWLLAAGSRSASPAGRGSVHVIGNNERFSYQFLSPPIPVQPGVVLRLAADLEGIHGTAAIGLLDEKGAWLVTPSVTRSTFEFATGTNRAVTVVVSAMDQTPPPLPVEFTLSQPELSVVRHADDYMHALTPCRPPNQRPP